MRTIRRYLWGLAWAGLALAAAGCSSGSPAAPVRLDAGPAAAATIAPVHVSVSGLPAAGLVTVQARTTDDQGRPWQSAAVFRASAAGTLNLASAVPVSGSYHTADAAGLLWSLQPASSASTGAAFVSSRSGFTVHLTVLTGQHVRATATLQRQFPVTASTQTVGRDGFAATFYTSAAVRSGAPAVVVIGGYPGGEDINVALGLAMSGYPALALAYYDQPGLPKCQCSTPLEYFTRAISWLRAQPAGRGRPVILYGASDGTQAALLLASYQPHLADAVVASSPTDVVHDAAGGTGPGWTYGGKPLAAGTLIPVSKIRVPLLIGDGGLDPVWDSAGSATTITSEIERTPGHAPVTNLYYPGAGHYYFGMFPYFPLFTSLSLGGTQQANALATEQFWTRMITFLHHVPAG
ncbi:MAG: acyl-CoA thioesterase/bile acid-CoA:amino acid N-acyltransferase family protein [Streptosporangiaceae bacterium]